MSLAKRNSIKNLGKRDSKHTFGGNSMVDMPDLQLRQSTSLRKRESKKNQKPENENVSKLLEIYNDMKAI